MISGDFIDLPSGHRSEQTEQNAQCFVVMKRLSNVTPCQYIQAGTLLNVETILDNAGTMLNNAWTILNNTETMLGNTETMLDNIATMLGNIGTMLGNNGTMLGNSGTMLDNIVTILDNIVTILDNIVTIFNIVETMLGTVTQCCHIFKCWDVWKTLDNISRSELNAITNCASDSLFGVTLFLSQIYKVIFILMVHG